MELNELGQLIKSKYPGSYDNIDDVELANKVISKYPVYADKISPSLLQSLFPTMSVANHTTDIKQPPTLPTSPNTGNIQDNNNSQISNDLLSLPGRAIAAGTGYVKNALQGNPESYDDLKKSLSLSEAKPYAPSQEPGNKSLVTDFRHGAQNLVENIVRNPATLAMAATSGLGVIPMSLAGAAASSNEDIANNKPTSLGDFATNAGTNLVLGGLLKTGAKSIGDAQSKSLYQSLGYDARQGMEDFGALKSQTNLENAAKNLNTPAALDNLKVARDYGQEGTSLKNQLDNLKTRLNDPNTPLGDLPNIQDQYDNTFNKLKDIVYDIDQHEKLTDIRKKSMDFTESAENVKKPLTQILDEQGITPGMKPEDIYNKVFDNRKQAGQKIDDFINKNNNTITPLIRNNNITAQGIIEDFADNYNREMQTSGKNAVKVDNARDIFSNLLDKAKNIDEDANGNPTTTLEKLINFKRDLQSEVNYNSPKSIADQEHEVKIYNDLQNSFDDEIRNVLKKYDTKKSSATGANLGGDLSAQYSDLNSNYSDLSKIKQLLDRSKAPGKDQMSQLIPKTNAFDITKPFNSLGNTFLPDATSWQANLAKPVLSGSAPIVPVAAEQKWQDFLNSGKKTK